jgi:hypothetical protein
MMRRLSGVLVLALLAVLLQVATPGDADAAVRRCPVGWGSLSERSEATSGASITNVRAGRHRCFDRLVLEVDGAELGYRVRYVRRLRQDGSGALVRVEGGAILRVVALGPAYDDDGTATVDPDVLDDPDFTRYRTFRDLAWAGSFEGQTTLGIGVRGRLPFRVFTLDGPGGGSRLVVDVAHRWRR